MPNPNMPSTPRPIRPPRTAASVGPVSCTAPVVHGLLRNDGELRGLNLEGLELTGATLWILCRDHIPHDSHRRIIGHDPLGDPELPFGLPFVLSVAHRHVNGFAGVGQVNDELSRAIALAGG